MLTFSRPPTEEWWVSLVVLLGLLGLEAYAFADLSRDVRDVLGVVTAGILFFVLFLHRIRHRLDPGAAVLHRDVVLGPVTVPLPGLDVPANNLRRVVVEEGLITLDPKHGAGRIAFWDIWYRDQDGARHLLADGERDYREVLRKARRLAEVACCPLDLPRRPLDGRRYRM